VRLDPSFAPQTQVAVLATSYAEQPDLDVDVRKTDRSHG